MGSGDNRIAGFCVELHLVTRTRTAGARQPMSALGQKQTFALQQVMSALPPKADMFGARTEVCFGPIADI